MTCQFRFRCQNPADVRFGSQQETCNLGVLARGYGSQKTQNSVAGRNIPVARMREGEQGDTRDARRADEWRKSLPGNS
jgi:hypothetical protein